MTDKPSTWQERITGEWHGMPSIFDAEGNHVGTTKFSKARLKVIVTYTRWIHVWMRVRAAAGAFGRQI